MYKGLSVASCYARDGFLWVCVMGISMLTTRGAIYGFTSNDCVVLKGLLLYFFLIFCVNAIYTKIFEISSISKQGIIFNKSEIPTTEQLDDINTTKIGF